MTVYVSQEWIDSLKVSALTIRSTPNEILDEISQILCVVSDNASRIGYYAGDIEDCVLEIKNTILPAINELAYVADAINTLAAMCQEIFDDDPFIDVEDDIEI